MKKEESVKMQQRKYNFCDFSILVHCSSSNDKMIDFFVFKQNVTVSSVLNQ